MARIKLTNKDKAYFTGLGYKESEFFHIEYALTNSIIEITDDNSKSRKARRCSAKRAIEILGRETFLTATAMADFHFPSRRYSPDGRYMINFRLKKWWESEKNRG